VKPWGLFVLAVALSLGQIPPQEAKPAKPEINQAIPIPAEFMDRLNTLILQQRLLEAQVCSRAKFLLDDCQVDWVKGVVLKRSEQKKQ